MPKLLIVDDEEDVREFAANFFRKRKIEVATASSGEEACALVKTQKPDMVLLDIQMSGMDGIEALRVIKDLNHDLKVIMVTGRKPDEEGTLERCRQLGVTDYIHKPLELDELERIVLSHIFPAKTNPL
ncbi:MAG: response regulator [Candidatus Omnitrophica bacterium]|nr:response regulator [Candidatus Omnitrophota bacterium]